MDLAQLKQSAFEEIEQVKDIKSLEQLRIKYLGRKGELTNILRSLKDLPLAERKKIGPQANALKKELEELLDKKEKKLMPRFLLFTPSQIDVTKPGKKIARGHLHPLTKLEQEIRSIFASMNFSVVEGPEIENEYYNFDALNIPKDHPARDMWDTFWLRQKEFPISNFQFPNKFKIQNSKLQKLLLRTHTSPMQVRYMETHEPPFQIIVPGRVFRYEATDASHEINFYQVEGLMVGPNITLANFKFVVETFLKKLFGPHVQFRLRPVYFPFVEPGIEVDIKLKADWLEVMGAGMVHPRVFSAVKYDPRKVQGFAFGLGLDRFAMIKYKVPDVRLFYSGDLRFIRQF